MYREKYFKNLIFIRPLTCFFLICSISKKFYQVRLTYLYLYISYNTLIFLFLILFLLNFLNLRIMDYSVNKPVEISNAVPLMQQGTEFTTVYSSSSNDSCSNGNVLSGGGGNYVFINLPANSLPLVVQPMLP